MGAAAAVLAARRRREAAAREAAWPTSTAHRVALQRQPGDVYAMWRNFGNAPRFMNRVVCVTEDAEGRSHWAADVPELGRVEWDAEVVDDRENELIVWRSLPGCPLYVHGRVRFEALPAFRGTQVTAALECLARPDASAATRSLADLLCRELASDLRRFKQWAEAGEVPTTYGQPTGTQPERQRVELRSTPAGGAGRKPQPLDPVDRNSMESFPASDPPPTP
jgi:uncharacterized membrane protein